MPTISRVSRFNASHTHFWRRFLPTYGHSTSHSRIKTPFLLRDGHGAANGRICGVDVSVYYALFSTRYGRWRVDIDQIEVYGASQIVASQQKSARAHDMIDAAASAPIGAVVDRQDPERLLDDMIVQRGADRRCVGNAGEIVRPIADAKASRP